MLPVGVILAGGAGARFGDPKGLERVAGVRIIDRVAAALAQVTSELLLAANDAAAAEWLPGVPLVADVIPGSGGLGGVHAALSRVRRPVLVVAWDMPFVTGPLLRELTSRGAAQPVGACVPISASPVGMEPFCAWYSHAILDPLDRALRSGACGAARFVHGLASVAWFAEDDARAFGDPERLYLSVNTRADLARAEAMASIAD